MTSLSPDTVRRIEDAAAALIAAGTANPTNEQVRAHPGGGSLSHISPVMRAFRARRREQRAEQVPALPPELAQLLTGQLGLLCQAAVKQADAGALATREQADADIAQADRERDEAQAKAAPLESELAVLREVVAERDRHRRTPGGTADGNESGAEGAREEHRAMQAELLMLARQEIRGKKATG
ncbi:DNA-binding protein [Klebsiella pneumoniae]|uniref:DNA-binding protein n=1 Tax=Klebsiella TaxID=570 RepID=UPI002B05B77A|nr:DNA-binding protein [Klebsiella variicola]